MTDTELPSRIGPNTHDRTMAICPHCTSQFRAISAREQRPRAALQRMLAAEIELRKRAEAALLAAEQERDNASARALAAEGRVKEMEQDERAMRKYHVTAYAMGFVTPTHWSALSDQTKQLYRDSVRAPLAALESGEGK